MLHEILQQHRNGLALLRGIIKSSISTILNPKRLRAQSRPWALSSIRSKLQRPIRKSRQPLCCRSPRADKTSFSVFRISHLGIQLGLNGAGVATTQMSPDRQRIALPASQIGEDSSSSSKPLLSSPVTRPRLRGPINQLLMKVQRKRGEACLLPFRPII